MVAAALHSTGPLCSGLACTSLAAARSRSSSGLILALPSAVSNLPSRFKGTSPLSGTASPALHSSFLPRYSKDNSHSNLGSLLSAGKPALSTKGRSAVPFSKGRAMASMSIEPAVIVGYGRVGQALEKMGGGKDVVVKRGERVPEGTKGPILVCTRNDALEEVIANTPEDRREDLVFLQNGMLEPYLASKGLQSATQVLVYFAVAKAGDAPIDGKTDVNPEGLTAATGKWAEAVAARLHSAGLSCKILDSASFRKSMLEKLIWISAFMLVGAKNPGATVGDVEAKYRDEVAALIAELAAVAEKETGLQLDEGLEERLCAYARSVASYPTAVKEFEWRNGWFFNLSKKAVEETGSDPCPLHTCWLRRVGAA